MDTKPKKKDAAAAAAGGRKGSGQRKRGLRVHIPVSAPACAPAPGPAGPLPGGGGARLAGAGGCPPPLCPAGPGANSPSRPQQVAGWGGEGMRAARPALRGHPGKAALGLRRRRSGPEGGRAAETVCPRLLGAPLSRRCWGSPGEPRSSRGPRERSEARARRSPTSEQRRLEALEARAAVRPPGSGAGGQRLSIKKMLISCCC